MRATVLKEWMDSNGERTIRDFDCQNHFLEDEMFVFEKIVCGGSMLRSKNNIRNVERWFIEWTEDGEYSNRMISLNPTILNPKYQN